MGFGFKPCYKWITFNTGGKGNSVGTLLEGVLNLVINGLPSILKAGKSMAGEAFRFKPCYKWITFNTPISSSIIDQCFTKVLNLVINGLPSIPMFGLGLPLDLSRVLNLVINGLPSIQEIVSDGVKVFGFGFKPCYKWITFNTQHY